MFPFRKVIRISAVELPRIHFARNCPMNIAIMALTSNNWCLVKNFLQITGIPNHESTHFGI